MALLRAIVRRGRRGLRVVSPPNPLAHDLLVGCGAAASIEFAYLGFQYEGGFVTAPHVRRAIETGAIEWRERDAFEIMLALRAGADAGRGEAAPVGALRPDVALLHAQAADRHGNLFISDPYADELLARASVRALATAERIVERIDAITVPAERIAAVAEVPRGAFPTSCVGHYPWSARHIRGWVEAAAQGRFGEYVETLEAPGLAAAPGPPEKPAAAPENAGAEPHPDPARAAAIDHLVFVMARLVRDGETVLTGVASALPVLAVALARATHAPRATHITAVGAVNPRLGDGVLVPVSSVDPRLLERCESRLVLPDILDLARQGRIDTMFFGAAQIDAGARLNLTCIGDPRRPRVKLPGPAGSASVRPLVRRVIVMAPRHTRRTFVERVDFITSAPAPANRETWVVTDLAVLRLHEDGRLSLAARRVGTTTEDLRGATGFALPAGSDAVEPAPSAAERAALDVIDPGGTRYRLA
jgi:glutaconate CoA-transferase, subunit B